MADRTISIKAVIDAQSYFRDVDAMARKTRESSDQIEARLEQQRQAYERVGAATTAFGLATFAALALTVKAAVDWESAWAGVTKTVSASPGEFAALEDSLRGLASELPATHEEIAAVAEAAGQLGIATQNIPEFTRVMIDMGEATNLSSTDAATALARFMNIMGTAQSDVSNLGSAVVALGNNYATTEAEIVEMSMRLAGAGRQVGLSEGEVTGLATALSSVGIEAEAGGSAVSKVMIDIAASVEEGGERLGQFAQVAGMSAGEFADQWRTAPGEALASFVRGLANAEAQGTSTLGILEDLGISEIRMRDALLRASSAADLFTGAMQDGNAAFADGTALQTEAENRYATLESQLGILRNRVNDAAISYGEILMPALQVATGALGGFADVLGGVPEPLQGLAVGGAAAAGSVALITGGALLAIPKIAEMRTAFDTLGVSMSGFTSRAGFMAAGGPYVVGIMAVVAALAAYVSAYEAAKPSLVEFEQSLDSSAASAELLLQQAQGWEFGRFSLEGVDMERLPRYLEILAERSDSAFGNFSELFDGDAWAIQASGMDNALRDLDSRLSDLSPEDAAASFRILSDDLGLSERMALDLLAAMPGLREQLLLFADANDISVTAANGTVSDLQLLQGVMDATGGSTAEVTEEFAAQAEAAAANQESIESLADAIAALNETYYAAQDSTAAYHSAILDATDAINEGLLVATVDAAGNLDTTTRAGIEAEATLSAIGETALQSAADMILLDQNTAGASQRMAEAREHFINAAMAAGLNADQAAALADRYGITQQAVQDLSTQILGVPDATATVSVETEQATAALNTWITNNQGRRIRVTVDTVGGTTYTNAGSTTSYQARGSVLDFMATGGIRLNPMSPVAQVVSPNTWRVVGDRMDVPEAYIPLDRSPRSFAILDETIRRMGGLPMANGAVLGGSSVATYGGTTISIALHAGAGGSIDNAAVDKLVTTLRHIGRGGRSGGR